MRLRTSVHHDIFYADKTGLFFKRLPDKTLTFKFEKCHGGQLSNERASLLLTTNMTGTEKLKLVLIGKSAKLRCFRRHNNKEAWMTSDIFSMWLLDLDKQFLLQNRKVLSLIDNYPALPALIIG
ncbi:unnamed protein product [Acanthoscelides obtectus]|uniref:DDE-1 domain-containing protein n=1 Tax=Acanthoscelides obtectus TaxID=200917 RepID=A0A9P0JTZ9_ACAOB|nr:unnamed protein product [Acanthoscelides obtectus]CAK1628070.1 Tigger transposable element-derived protein 4 [Acanthoscelides obtectus]